MPYIGKSPSFGVRNRFVYVASSGDTSVSGADANGATLTFTDGAFVDVYLNGVLLKPTTDYNTSTANTIAGLSALNTNDEVTVIVYDVFTVADMVSATSGGTFSGNVTHSGTVTANSTLDMNGTELILDADADSSITADTDDEIHFKVAGDDHVKIKGGTNVLHVIEGSSGQGTPHTNSGVVIESDGETGINILTGNTNYGGIIFGDDGDNDIGFIQFFHRLLATLTLIYVLITFFYLFKSKLKAIYFLAVLVIIVTFSQYLLGIIMLKLFVPIHLGLSHQLGSLILLSSLIITKCEIIKKRAINRPSF